METFNVHILGCGSALPTIRHFNSAQVVEMRNKLFLIDCGEGTQIQLRRSKLHFNKINQIFISHLHGDHCLGLVGLLATLGLLGRTADMHIYAPAPMESLLRPQLDFFCYGMSYHVIVHEIDSSQHACIYEDRSVEVHTLPLKHRMPCCGFLFREKPVLPHIRKDMIDFYHIPHYAINPIKEGNDYVLEDGTVVPCSRLTFPAEAPRSYAYCSDTAYLPQLTKLIKGVNLLFHEATFGQDEQARAKQTFHSTAQQAAQIAKDACVNKLIIGHFSARYENEKPLLEEAQTVFPNTELTAENKIFKL